MTYTNVRLFRKHTKTIIGSLGLAILSALVILTMTAPTAAVMQQTATAAATSQPISYIPTPVMNTNVTWSTFNSSWAELEYSNGTSLNILPAEPNTAVRNPITITPGDITPRTLNGKYAGTQLLNASNYAQFNSLTVNNYKFGNEPNGIFLTGNASSTSEMFTGIYTKIPWGSMPSQNTAYDYITAVLTMPAGEGNTSSAVMIIANSTANGDYGTPSYKTEPLVQTGQSQYFEMNINQMIAGSGININSSKSPYIYLGFQIEQSAGPPADTPIINVSLTNMAITTYPITLGQNSTGAIIYTATGTANLTKFDPTVPMTIENEGYTVAITQNLQNTTESQSSISSSSYIEQATYQGILSLPSAPDLTYSNSAVQMNMTVPGSQFEVANLNGISYLSSIQTKTNGTFTFGTVNPNAQNTLILEIEFTASQWNASTTPPSFFSIQGIEYYWWVGVIGLLSIVGLGAAASSHFNGEEENLKVPKGKFGR